MYLIKDPYSYMPNGSYKIMPIGLPSRFYPKEPSRKYETENYIICFCMDLPEELKQRFIQDFLEQEKEEKITGLYY